MNRTYLNGIIGLTLAGLLAACPSPAKKNTVADPVVPTPGGDTGVAKTDPAPTTPPPQPQELSFPEEEFRKTQPPAGEPRPLQIPGIKTFKLDNGITVYLVERDDLPVASIELNFDGGSMNDPKGKEGLASVCMSMMSEGTQQLPKIQLDEALADIASSVSSYAGRETQGVSMRSLTKHLDRTYAIYKQVLFEPAFAESDFQRVIQQRLEGLKQVRGNPSGVARRIGDRVLYGDKHPFGRIVTEASLGKLTIADCQKYHAANIKPSGARLFAVGKISEQLIRDKFSTGALAGWKGKGAKRPRLPNPRSMKGKIFFSHVDGAEQSQIYVMHFGPKRKAKDYFPTSLAGRILGGGFTSRLNMNLREDKGYSYGARGGFNYSRDYGEFTGSTSVRSDATWQSVLEMYDEMIALQTGKKAATQAELDQEKNGAILGLPGQFDTMRAVLGSYRGLVYYDLPLDYYDSYVGKVQAVDLKQVNAAAKKHLKAKNAIILVVGNGDAPQKQHTDKGDEPLVGADGKPVTLLDGLQQLAKQGRIGKGKVVVLDADGNVQ